MDIDEEESDENDYNIKNNKHKDNLKDIKWKPLKPDEMITYEEDIEHEEDVVRNIPPNLKTPYDFYSLFIDDDFINSLVKHTNEYAQYKKLKNTKNKTEEEKNQRKTMAERWTAIDSSKMERYLATVILMGIHRLPEYKDHFSKDQLLGSAVQKFITQWNYEKICGFLHASEVGKKGKEKIVDVINDIMSKSQKYYYPGTSVTIDERMISYKGKSRFVVYEPAKPTRYGFRPYVLSDHKSGYTYALQLLEDLEESNDGSKIYNLVMNFMNCLNRNNLSGKKHILATDGLYTSEKLLTEDSFYFIGSIRYNRIKTQHSEITKPLKNGEYQYYYKKINGKYILLTKYMDNKLILIVSNFLNSSNTLNRFRWDKKEMKFVKKKYPEVIKTYSNLMKGVDIGNQLISYYELRHKTYKWWKRILFHLIDISIVNSFIIYKKVRDDKTITQKQFRLDIIRAISYKYGIIPIFKPLVKTKTMHLIKRAEKRGSCTHCSKTKNFITARTPTSLYICPDCNVHLCVECFEIYHKSRFLVNISD